jgi:tetratricopeptide (TPR) repeat protein
LEQLGKDLKSLQKHLHGGMAVLPAVKLASEGKFEEAELFLRGVLKRQPEDAGAWSTLAMVLVSQGRNEEAEDAFTTGLSYNPRDATTWRDFGVLLTKMEHKDEARDANQHAAECLRADINDNPNDTAAWLELGQLLREQGRDEEAEECLRHADDYHNGIDRFTDPARAVIAAKKGQLSEAERNLRETIKKNPTNVLAWRDLGLLLLEQGMSEEASKVLHQGFAKLPPMSQAGGYNDVAWKIYDRRAQHPEYLEFGLTLADKSLAMVITLPSLDTRACLLSALERWEEARDAFIEATRHCRTPADWNLITKTEFRNVLNQLDDSENFHRFKKFFEK